jgi:predicted RNase H-like nuclease (RuvC/YqgF family)
MAEGERPPEEAKEGERPPVFAEAKAGERPAVIAEAKAGESEAKVKQKELAAKLRERGERVKRQQERLEKLNEQLEQLEGPQRHSIEQLRHEIDRVDKLLNSARAEQSAVKATLTECTEHLERKTEDKRSASDQLYTMLLDSEEGKLTKLEQLEKRFAELTDSLSAPLPAAPAED